MKQKLVNQLNELLSDENLTDDKLRKASEGLLPNIANILNADIRAEQSLLDNFATLAMQGILSSQVHFRGNGASNEYKEATQIARESYVIAIAMLKVREEVNNG